MPNLLDSTGLQLNTREEWLEYFTEKYQEIYGADINLASDTPDGQWLGITVQALTDLGDLIMQVFNSFDPDNAIGTVLDQRLAINGVERQAGTYTITPITLVTTQSVNLYGKDQEDDEDPEPVYTVQDNAGNQWELIDSELGLSAGTHILNFQAAVPGAQLTVPNTITTPVSIVLGVSSVNNPSVYTTLGIDEESDTAVKVRRRKAVANGSQGYLAGLLGTLENIPGMTSAFVYENDTDTTALTVPPHSIWVITAGTAASADIAEAIYKKRNAGCGMKGDESYNILQVDGSYFEVRWDEYLTQPLFIFLTLTGITDTSTVSREALINGLAAGLTPGINESVDITSIGTILQSIDPNVVVYAGGVTDGYTSAFAPSGTPASGTFSLKYGSTTFGPFAYNENVFTIETAIEAVLGVGTVQVFGTLAGTFTIIINDPDPENQTLIYFTNNTVLTAGAAQVNWIRQTTGQSPVETPNTPQFQFSIAPENIIITNIAIYPEGTVTVGVLEQLQLSAYGGYSTLTWSISSNGSGCSINASTGLYTAGPAPGIDFIKVKDVFLNEQQIIIEVI